MESKFKTTIETSQNYHLSHHLTLKPPMFCPGGLQVGEIPNTSSSFWKPGQTESWWRIEAMLGGRKGWGLALGWWEGWWVGGAMGHGSQEADMQTNRVIGGELL